MHTLSTSINPIIGYLYTDIIYEVGGALTKIIIPKGSSALYLSPVAYDGSAEKEILLGSGLIYQIVRNQELLPYWVENVENTTNDSTCYEKYVIPTNVIRLYK